MSEYTDYLLYQSEAMTLQALQAEVTQNVGRAVIVPFTIGGMVVTEAEAMDVITRAPARKWVALIADIHPADIKVQSAAHFLVLEDFKSWRLNAVCDGQEITLQFGGPDGYGLGWFGANFDAPFVTATIEDETLNQLAACFGTDAAKLAPVLAYDKPWAFLDVIGAPSVQMLDQQLAMIGWDRDGGAAVASFEWNTVYDD